MYYKKTIKFEGNPQQVLQSAQSLFVQIGYKITYISEDEISAEHEGAFTKSMSSNPMYGASPIKINITNDVITILAWYQGVEKTKKFMIKLLVSLAFILGLGLGITFMIVFDEKWPALFGLGLGFGIPLLQLPIHLIITPKIIKKRAANALDTFIHNVTILAK